MTSTRKFIIGIGAAGVSLLTGVGLFFSRKSTKKAVTKDFISGEKLKEIMYGYNLNTFNEIVQDSEYGLPTIPWIEDILYPELFKRQRKNNSWEWKQNSNECNHYANRAVVLAHELNNLTENSGVRSLAFGTYIYTTKEKIKHAFNFAVVKQGEEYKIAFFEPQIGKTVELTKSEIYSVTGWII